MIEHQACGEDGADGVGDAFAGDVGGGAVDRLEHAGMGAFGVEVGAGGQPEAAGDDGGQVGEDIAEEVAGHDYVEGFRPADQVHGGGVHEQGARFPIGELATHAGKTSSHKLMLKTWAVDLVMEVTCLRRWRAARKAARMMRSQPRRVKMADCTAISSGVP